MEDIKMMDAVERYIRGEMSPDERVHFEQLRKANPDVDQLVVEHTFFLHRMNRFGERRKFRNLLQEVHVDLAEKGIIHSSKLKGKAKVAYLWNRYRRVTAIASSIAGITALAITALVLSLRPTTPPQQFEQLKGKVNSLEYKSRQQDREINNVKSHINTPEVNYTTGGTSFMVDASGYLLTNAHVVANAKNVAVQNNKGEQFIARIVHFDAQRDLAILMIEDDAFKAAASIPYSISKESPELAEPIYTLGFPRNEIVYGQGYLSAKTGYNGDTLSCQIELAANRGNSGSPILNRSGEVIGVLNGRQRNAEGFAFAITSKYIRQALETLKDADSTHKHVKVPTGSSLRGLDRVQQVKRMEEYVFMVKVN